MPGQYFDSESGLFYNWNRYYNPAIGRYITSDPIGLEGGLNTFNYAEASPVMYVDPEGKNLALAGVVTTIIGGVVIAVAPTPVCDVACTQGLLDALASAARSIGNGMTYNACFPIAAIRLGYGAEEFCRQFADEVCPPATASPGVDGPAGATGSEMGKDSKQSGKEKATDIPSYAKGYQKDPNENCHDFAISILEQEFGENHSKVLERGPGSDYSKIKKNCERGGK